MTRSVFLALIFLAAVAAESVLPQSTAPSAPGKDAQWATAGKQAVGSSENLVSKVWFTLAQGVLTEVYYPDVTVANIHLLQFVVVNSKTKTIETEQDNSTHSIEVKPFSSSKEVFPLSQFGIRKDFYSPSSLVFEQRNRSSSGTWAITKTYLADPQNNSIIFSFKFQSEDKDNELYVYFDPSLANSGMGDSGWSSGRYFLSTDGKISAAFGCGRCSFSEMTNGFLGVNDGLTQLKQSGKIQQQFTKAENGNLVQVAKITQAKTFSEKSDNPMQFAIGFGDSPDSAAANAHKTLERGFENVYQEYQLGWAKYLQSLPKVDERLQGQFNMAAMQLKIHEDKTVRGANIASLSVPWGGGASANENNIGGYHLIWSRDLYQVATAFWAIGAKDAAVRALNFLFKIQQKEDGSFPQNSYLDGRPFWGSLQLDEVAYPLIMAWEFGVHDKQTYLKHVKRAADFIVKNGPATPQERWEEESGYSPSTLAAEIAGLVCAAEIARKNGDYLSAELYLKTADSWEAKIEKWTATTTGKYGDGSYYLRITQNGKPDAGEKIELNNGAGFFDEREIVDAGFLELVRLGIRRPDDPLIKKSVGVVDQVIRVKTPNGDGFYRYNNDGYGEMNDGRRWNFDGKYTGKGRLWALLSGERGQYEIALANTERGMKKNDSSSIVPQSAFQRLETMAKFANDGMMIPEQIWDSPVTPKSIDKQFVPKLRFGEGTGSATPLAWSMAQFIRLATNLEAGRNLDTPEIVYNRYVLRRGR